MSGFADLLAYFWQSGSFSLSILLWWIEARHRMDDPVFVLLRTDEMFPALRPVPIRSYLMAFFIAAILEAVAFWIVGVF